MKCLRKVKVSYANPVPVLQVVDMCEKLQEVAVWYPEHCEVGIYEMCIQMVVIPVPVLPCTNCSPPQRTGSKCPPVWLLHST